MTENGRMAGQADTTQGRARRGLPWGKLALLVVAIVLVVMLGRQASGYVGVFTAWLEGLGPWGPIAFILGYVLATVAFVPGSVLTLAAGALFGLLWGTVIVFVAATLGASAAFLVSRYLARKAIERRLAGNERFAAIDRAIASQGRKIVFLLRLSPVFPFNLLNYGLGLTKVGYADYLMASVGMIPGTLLYVYYGKVIGDVAKLAGGATIERDAGYYAVLGLGLAATIVVTTVVTRLARKALREATGEVSPPGNVSPAGAGSAAGKGLPR